MTVFEPQQFGKYQLLDKIATGGMAELYRAKLTGAEGFEKLIAIKKILPHLSCEGELVKAFIDEAKLAALLQHENIVQIYDFGNLEGEYFIHLVYETSGNGAGCFENFIFQLLQYLRVHFLVQVFQQCPQAGKVSHPVTFPG